MIFIFSEYWWLYLSFTVFVLFLVFLDMGVLSKKSKQLSTTQALLWSAGWISLGVLVGLALWYYVNSKFGAPAAQELTLEYFSGFLIEKALAIDNIFVFVLIFGSLKITPHLQKKVLGYGILGALFFRAIFISIGAILIKYQFVLVIFGAFLILTGLKMVWPQKEEKKLEDTWLYRKLSTWLPFTKDFVGEKFWTYSGGKFLFTPLFLALALIELTDIIFAIDSVPAIFAVTGEPLIVFMSNMMAILGLRSLYLVLADAVHRFVYLKYGLAFILIFVGLKMLWLNHLFDGHFPITWSLAVIGLAIFVSVIASLKKTLADN